MCWFNQHTFYKNKQPRSRAVEVLTENIFLSQQAAGNSPIEIKIIMKISKYNLIVEDTKGVYIYNSYTNSLIEINNNLRLLLNDNKLIENISNIEQQTLRSHGFLIDGEFY